MFEMPSPPLAAAQTQGRNKLPDYYRILEVDPAASKEVIEKAFKALSQKKHPDKVPTEDKQDAERAWLEIRDAYEVLKDDDKRAVYDASRKREMLKLFMNEGVIGLAKKYLR